MSIIKPVIQLYSVRDHLDKDPDHTLKSLSDMGYAHVEMAGTAGLEHEAFKVLLNKHGLTAVSSHLPYEKIVEQTESIIEEARLFDLEFVVVPWLGGDAFGDAHAWQSAASQMNSAGAILRSAGIKLCYHNHAHEFAEYDGKTAFDHIFDHSESTNLGLELDTAWAAIGNSNVPALIDRFKGRLPLLHLKDYRLDSNGEPVLTELGHGIIKWGPILEAAQNAGVIWYIAELDNSESDSLESAHINISFMQEYFI